MRFFTYTLFIFFLFTPLVFVWAHSDEERKEVVIEMTDEGFVPKEITITQGDTIIFKSIGSLSKWPASNIHPTHSIYPGSDIRKCGSNEKDQVFDACGLIKPGDSYSFVFGKKGEWRFHDHVHPKFSGKIIVLEDPDYIVEEVESDSLNEQGFLKNLIEKLSIFFQKMYYKIFSGARAEKLSELDVYTIALNDDSLEHWLHVFGPDTIFNDLIADVQGHEYLGCHLEAHLVGRMAQKIYNVSPLEVFDDRCQFGYYHGLLESFLENEGSEDIVLKMDEQCASLDSFSNRSKCFHGIGHGIMVFNDYDLPISLRQCEKLESASSQDFCYGGVFMENSLTAINFDTGGGHASEWVSDDPHYPCNVLEYDDPALPQCYGFQALTMLQIFEQDYSKVIKTCTQAPTELVSSCFWSVGFYGVAPPALPDIPLVTSLCKENPQNENQRSCVLGATQMLAYVWGSERRKEATILCNNFSKPIQNDCLKTIKQILGNESS